MLLDSPSDCVSLNYLLSHVTKDEIKKDFFLSFVLLLNKNRMKTSSRRGLKIVCGMRNRLVANLLDFIDFLIKAI